MAKMKNMKLRNAGQYVEQTELSYIDERNAKWYNNLGKQLGT